ncbi:hypothetical protein TSUD_364800 [Trifolium subterraneum]|uniref:Uncharacterized protein n=1 Tax=Trifolium subterraneum TaxID=3900 RepID=A0A2Z6MLA9_TRISU|nr:hypothetical protein TSUD_364800 [Trifolium subterraneum]
MVSGSSNMDRLILTYCNISNDFFPKGLNFLSNVKDLNLSGNNFTTVHAWIKDCHLLRNLKLDNCSHLQEIRGVPKKLETFSVKGCTSLKFLDLTVLPACTLESCSLKELIVDDCVYLQNITGLPQNLDLFSAKGCTALNSQSISILLNQEGMQAGNKMFLFPRKKIPEWFRPRTSVKKVHGSRVVRKQEIAGSFSFWFRNKFPAISLCLVLGLGNEQPLTVKFSPRVFINGIKQCIGCQKVYKFVIATDHVFLLMLEDNGDMVLSDNQWKHVEVSYVDHITNGEVPIRQGARYSGIHVFEQTTDPGDFQFTNPPQTMINTNLNSTSAKEAHHRVKITAERPQKEQTKVLPSPILSLSHLQPPIAEAKKGPGSNTSNTSERSLEDFIGETSERSLEDFIGETSERFLEEEVNPTTIPNDPPVIQSYSEGDDNIEHVALSSSELESEDSYSKTESEGSDSDDPFDCVHRRLGISAKETVSSASSSVDSSIGPIREAINSLEMLMVKDLSEVSSDPDTQSGLHQLLDLLCQSSHPKVTVEVKEAIHDFRRKAFLSFQEFQSTVESVNKLKDFEKHLERIQQETVAGKGRRKDLKNSIKNFCSAIKTENSRKNDLEAEIATLRIQLSSKERSLEQLVLNLKNQKESLSTYSTTYASLNEQAQALLKQADDLLAASSGVKHEGKAAEAKQITLKSTWSIDLTNQFNKIKNNIHLL